MPVEYRYGNIFDFNGNLAHGTNASGKMNKGIAVEFKDKFPVMFSEYENLCKAGRHQAGMVYAYNHIDVTATNLHEQIMKLSGLPVTEKTDAIVSVKMEFWITRRTIYNLCIKPHWKMKSEDYIVASALRQMVKMAEEEVNKPVPSFSEGFHPTISDPLVIAMPAIGCGLGGLKWDTQVKQIIEEVGSKTPCTLVVYLQEECKEKNVSTQNIDPHDADPTRGLQKNLERKT
jgi:O-acetyl-ADP-ribose deacetylase (regulator of RNase III)